MEQREIVPSTTESGVTDDVIDEGWDDELDQVFARTYGVELLFDEHPSIPVERMIASISAVCGEIEVVNKDHLLLFFFKDYPVSYADGNIHAQIAIMLPSDQVHDDRGFEASLAQSWRWQEARDNVHACQTCMLVTDLMASGLDYKVRMKLFQKALYAIVEACDCRALHFRLSEQFIDRDDYLSNKPGAPEYDILLGIMNVRLFNIEGAEEEVVIDTIGLSAIGLPDLQVHFRGLDVNDAAKLLYSYGDYIFANGDVIEDGHTIGGVNGEPWRCRHEVSLIEPKRIVLDLHAGEHAAGERN